MTIKPKDIKLETTSVFTQYDTKEIIGYIEKLIIYIIKI